MMPTATLTSKGQVTLPKEVRDRLGLRAGDRIEFVETDRGFVVVPATQDIRAIKGIVPKPRKAVTVEEMNRAIRRMGAIE
jgi:AbrB family looped-hinge helix DNA binding protein